MTDEHEDKENTPFDPVALRYTLYVAIAIFLFIGLLLFLGRPAYAEDIDFYETNPDPEVGEEVGELYNHSTGERWIIYMDENQYNIYDRDTGEWTDIRKFKALDSDSD